MAVALLVSTPIAIKIIGAEQWGIVAIGGTLQAILLLLDAGMRQIMPREIAHFHVNGHAKSAYRMFLYIYLVAASAGFLLGQSSVSYIVQYALPENSVDASTIEMALRIALVQFLFQLPNSAAIGYWDGTEQQAKANIRQSIFGVSKYATGLASIAFLEPTAAAYLLPFAALSALEFFINVRAVAIEPELNEPTAGTPAPAARAIIGGVAAFTPPVVIGMLTSQVDRIVLSLTTPTASYGIYVAVTTLALAMSHLSTPIYRAFLPKISASAHLPIDALNRMAVAMFFICFVPCVLAAFYSQAILELWLRDGEVAQVGAKAFQYTAISVGLNGIFSVAYAVIIRNRQFKALIIINIAMLCIQLLYLYSASSAISIEDGALSKLIAAVLQLMVGAYILNSEYSVATKIKK